MRPSNSTRHFYPRPPRGGRLHTIRVNGWGESISIHALREEGDTEQQHKASTRKKFLSTPSARRATQWRTVALATGEISIHALREEGDRIRARIVEVQVISIHALREEGDPAEQKCSCGVKRFLSTPSARRATTCAGREIAIFEISIHALREEGDVKRAVWAALLSISIHALREEGDPLYRVVL